eukprot:jgi/Ulvmu1/11949/UM082_0028.1
MIGAASLTGAAQGLLLGAAFLLNNNMQPIAASRLSQRLSHAEPTSNDQEVGVFNHMRQLLDATAPQPVFVTSPRQLEDAILQGRQHIVVTAHLDMTAMPLRDTSICLDGCESPLPEIREAMSIRGKCESPPDDNDLAVLTRTPGAVQMVPVQAGQCVIITNEDLLPILSFRFWLDNVYLRAVYHNVPNDRAYQYISLLGLAPMRWPLRGEGKRYVTRTTFQGDGTGPTVGIWADENVYVENCTFVNLGGDGTDVEACADCTGAINVNNAFVSVTHSTFYDPVSLPATSYIRAWDNSSVLLTKNNYAAVPGVTESFFYARDNSTVYSDDATIRVRSEEGPPQPPTPAAQAPATLPGTNLGFLAATDPWLVNTVASLNQTLPANEAHPAPQDPVPELEIAAEEPLSALQSATPVSTDEVAGAPGDDDDDGLPTSAIIAIIVPAVLVILICLVACCVLRRQKKRKAAAAAKEAAAGVPVGGMAGHMDQSVGGPAAGAAMSGVPWDKSSIRSDEGKSAAGSNLAQQPSHAASAASTAPSSAHPALLNVQSANASRQGSGVAVPVPPAGAPLLTKLAFVQSQLDSLGPDAAIMAQFRLLGTTDRRQGGHSVVAFATGAHDRLPYAIKFFAVREPFDAELAVRRDEIISTLAPHIKAVSDPYNTDAMPGHPVDRFGRPLPPCIVVARGESLTEWSRRAKPDVFQAVAVLAHVANRLRDLHASQHVHRDVKPAHIILLPRENRWTVVDFNRAAATGAAVAPDYTLDYVPPEVLAAAEARDPTIVAEPSQDAWALGVVAFELLTGEKAFDSATNGEAAVKAQLLGQAPLPWEGDRLCAETRHKLGIFCSAVLGLLRREPAKRDAMQDFCNTCNDVVMSHTTVAAQ